MAGVVCDDACRESCAMVVVDLGEAHGVAVEARGMDGQRKFGAQVAKVSRANCKVV